MVGIHPSGVKMTLEAIISPMETTISTKVIHALTLTLPFSFSFGVSGVFSRPNVALIL